MFKDSSKLRAKLSKLDHLWRSPETPANFGEVLQHPANLSEAGNHSHVRRGTKELFGPNFDSLVIERSKPGHAVSGIPGSELGFAAATFTVAGEGFLRKILNKLVGQIQFVEQAAAHPAQVVRLSWIPGQPRQHGLSLRFCQLHPDQVKAFRISQLTQTLLCGLASSIVELLLNAPSDPWGTSTRAHDVLAQHSNLFNLDPSFGLAATPLEEQSVMGACYLASGRGKHPRIPNFVSTNNSEAASMRWDKIRELMLLARSYIDPNWVSNLGQPTS